MFTANPINLAVREIIILQFHSEVKHPGVLPEELDRDALFRSYPIEIDFGFHKTGGYHTVVLKVAINFPEDGDPLAGYSLFIECMGYLEKTAEFDDVSDENAFWQGALALVMHFIRNYIANHTGHQPLGKYWLPSFSMNDLMASKKTALAAKAAPSDNSSKGRSASTTSRVIRKQKKA